MGTVKINTGYTPEEMKNSEWFGSGGGGSPQWKTPEFKPCPFCGGKAQIVFKDGSWFIRCEDCYAKSESWSNKNASPESLYYAIEEAVEAAAHAWNRRVTDENT